MKDLLNEIIELGGFVELTDELPIFIRAVNPDPSSERQFNMVFLAKNSELKIEEINNRIVRGVLVKAVDAFTYRPAEEILKIQDYNEFMDMHQSGRFQEFMVKVPEELINGKQFMIGDEPLIEAIQ